LNARAGHGAFKHAAWEVWRRVNSLAWPTWRLRSSGPPLCAGHDRSKSATPARCCLNSPACGWHKRRAGDQQQSHPKLCILRHVRLSKSALAVRLYGWPKRKLGAVWPPRLVNFQQATSVEIARDALPQQRCAGRGVEQECRTQGFACPTHGRYSDGLGSSGPSFCVDRCQITTDEIKLLMGARSLFLPVTTWTWSARNRRSRDLGWAISCFSPPSLQQSSSFACSLCWPTSNCPVALPNPLNGLPLRHRPKKRIHGRG